MDTVTPQRNPNRNDPCPCGSGCKYKRCCMPTRTGAPYRVVRALSHGRKALEKRQREQEERRAKVGAVRQAIHADYRGYKFVAVGDRLYRSKNWRTFLDFLQDDYIKSLLT